MRGITANTFGFGTEHVFTLNSKKLNKLLCNANNAPKTDIIGLCIA